MLLKDILSKVDIAKQAYQRILRKVRIKKCALIIFYSCVLFLAIMLMYYKDDTSYLNLEQISLFQGELTSLTILIFLLCLNVILCLVDVIKKEDSEALSYLSKFIYEAESKENTQKIKHYYEEASKYMIELDEHRIRMRKASAHSERESGRQVIIYFGIFIICVLVFICALFLKMSAYEIAIIGIWIGYILMICEYLNYQHILKKRKLILHTKEHKNRVVYSNKDYVGKMSCQLYILKMTNARYSSYLLSLSVANLATNAFIIIITVLDITGVNLNDFFCMNQYLDGRFIITILMFVSFAFMIMMVFLKNSLVDITVKISLIERGEILYGEKPSKESYDKLLSDIRQNNIMISKLDTSRGKHEYNIHRLENNLTIENDELFGFSDRKLTHFPRLYLLWLTEGLTVLFIFLKNQNISSFIMLLVGLILVILMEYFLMIAYLNKRYPDWKACDKDNC